MVSLGKRCANFFLPIAIHTDRQVTAQKHFGLTFRQRVRVPHGRPLCMDSILLVNESNKKQRLK